MSWFYRWVLVIVGIFNIAFGTSVPDRKLDDAALKTLCEGLGINSQNIVAETQKKWLRKRGQELWQMKELPEDQRNFVLTWATEQGFYAPLQPTRKSYDKALIIGATTSRMETRLEYLKQLWLEGLRFKEIVWLTGDRPLDPKAEKILENCKTEADIAKQVWEKADLPMEMKELPVVFIISPKTSLKPRPTLEDTILDWLKTSPDPCSCLFISNQPYCGHHFAVIKYLLPRNFQPDVAGEGTDPNKNPRAGANTLDAIARWIYMENKACSR